jgi:hypothetical protein
MSINKNFVVRHGFEVSSDLILADADTRKVGVGTTRPTYDFTVAGGIGATDIFISGVGTFSSIISGNVDLDNANINSGIISTLTSNDATISTLSGQNLNYSGISTIGILTSNIINSENIQISGISSLTNIVFDGYLSIGNTTGKLNQVLVSTGTGVIWSQLSKNSILSVAAPGQDTFLLSYEIGSVEIYINGVRLAANEFTATTGETVTLNDPCFGGETVEIIASQTLPTGTIERPLGLIIEKDANLVGTANSIQLLNFTGAGVSVSSISSFGVEINIDPNPPGKTFYVSMNGNDSNDGLTLDFPKKTIKAAVGVSSSGDTIKVSAGTYIENNPIILPENVSIEGAELRNCIVTPQNPGNDLFWVSNGNHITDLSFQGQAAIGDVAVIAFKPLQGTASGRYFDAARMIRYNLDFIASEAVGYLTSTDYRSPAFTLTSGDYTSCKDDIKDIFRAVCHDITRGGNSKCVGAGLSYYTGSTLQHIVGVKTETIDTIRYAAGIAQSCINNVLWTGNYQNEYSQLKDLSIQADSDTGSNIDIGSCANVVSAIYSCVGVVTTIINQGPDVVGTSFNLTYPGNNGNGVSDLNDIPFQGVGNVTKGPYIRNCTNFIPGSVGMRVDGFHAEPGDQNDIGITGMMSVDSYTQYNQGGIGVEISNGAYAQLVSIFTICNNKAIVTRGGGQCDITNSNSSFGTEGLISDGVSNSTSKSIYRYTGEVHSTGLEDETTIVVSQIGNERPHSGQALYFDELYYEISGVTIIDGGSGYTEAPNVVFLTDPTGPSAIPAEAAAVIQNGKVVSVNMIGNGRNYRFSDNPVVTFTSPTSGTTAAAIVNLIPIYYQIISATTPSAGISTVSLVQSLNNDVGIGTIAYFSRQSLQIVSSHSFQYIGAGNTIELARPSKGGVTMQENEVVKINGGEIAYTSTDQDGNFAIGDDLVIEQSTGIIRGRSFERSLLNTVTPFIIALGAK